VTEFGHPGVEFLVATDGGKEFSLELIQEFLRLKELLRSFEASHPLDLEEEHPKGPRKVSRINQG